MLWKNFQDYKEETEILDELWSNEPIDLNAWTTNSRSRFVEEKRLKSMGVLPDLLDGEQDLEILTTRSVHDWRIKTRA